MKIQFTGTVTEYKYEKKSVSVSGRNQVWHLHTFYVDVDGQTYIWTRKAEEKPAIEIGEVHTFIGTVSVQIVGHR